MGEINLWAQNHIVQSSGKISDDRKKNPTKTKQVDHLFEPQVLVSC